jgi:phage terminase large subunit GpA-like protein
MLDWKPGVPETVVLMPPCCGAAIEERHKPAMVDAGEWRATAPEVKGHAGFQFSALTSSFSNAAWPVLVSEYEKAKRAGQADMQVFWNTVLGRVWSQTIDYVSESELMNRRQPFGIEWLPEKSRWREDIPADVAYITAGVDVQPNRFEIVFWGWAPQNEFALGHHVILGDVRLKSTQDELYSVLATQWKHPLGAMIGISASAVDSGDGNTTEPVYRFVEDHPGQNIFAIKGRSGPERELRASASRRKGNWRAPLFIVGTDNVKASMMSALPRMPSEEHSIRFSDGLEEQWFMLFASERLTIKYKNGRPLTTFEPIGRRRQEA